MHLIGASFEPLHSVRFWAVQRTSEMESQSETDDKNAIYILPSSEIFWVNAHCHRLSARAPPATAAAAGYMAAGDDGPRWKVT
jgi:hypothetical protein